MKTTYLTLLLLSVFCLQACSNSEAQITNRIQIELDDCKRSDKDVHEIKFEEGDPYPMYKVLCDEPITGIATVELDGEGSVGPYKFYFRKNVKEDRWTLARVKWDEMEEASNYYKQADKGEAEFKRIDELLATAMTQAPQIADIPVKRMKYLMEWRKLKKGKTDTNPTSLGVAEKFYKEGIALAQKNGDKDQEVQLRSLVLTYWDQKRAAADEAAAPNEQWREWEEAAVKAILNQAKDAKKAGNAKLAAEKRKEAEARRKSIPAEEAKLHALKAEWGKRAKELAKVQCAEISAGSTVVPKDPDLKEKWLALTTSYSCP